mgnify:CR=1 FL=1
MVLILIVLPQKDIPEVDDWYHRIYIDKWVHAGKQEIIIFKINNKFNSKVDKSLFLKNGFLFSNQKKSKK